MTEPLAATPVGAPVPGWTPPSRPARDPMTGRCVRLEPLSADHAGALFAAYRADTAGTMWAYLGLGPFAVLDDFRTWVAKAAVSEDPLHFTVLVDGVPLGTASYLRIDPGAGSIEVGHITFSPALQKTRAATEAMYLMMEWAFSAGYRRYEWKCNAQNGPSRRAAQRFGFSYEGTFRQAGVIKGRNRDTAWYACTDAEWPALREAFTTWLSDDNFDAGGQQRQSLSALTRGILVATG